MDVVAIGDNISDCYADFGQVFPGGNAVNVAVAVARAGGRSSYVGVVGDDVRGRMLVDSLIAESVDVRGVTVAAGTTACAVVRHVDGERVFGAVSRGVAHFRPTQADLAIAASAHLAHTTYCSALEEFVPELARRVPVSFDFGDRFDDGYPDGLLPHVRIAEFSAAGLDDAECADLLRWAHARGPDYVLATRGSRGAMFFDGTELTVVTAAAPAVVDTLGAGDAFTGRALYGLVAGQPIADLLAASAKAAGETCAGWGGYGHGAPIPADCSAPAPCGAPQADR